jgi:hypothetical protein
MAIANAIAAAVVDQSKQEVSNRLEATRLYLAGELSSTSGQIDSVQKMPSTPARQTQLATLQAQYAATYGKLQDITISQTRGQSAVAVSDPATVPSRPIAPDPLRWLLAALLAGLCAGVIIALLAEHYDDRLTSPEGLARASGTSLVMMVPRRKAVKEGSANPFILAHANLIVRHPNAHRVMIAPASARDRAEGLALQFGMAAAHTGHRVVVVQADVPENILSAPLSPNGTALTTIPLAAPSDPRLVSRALMDGGAHDLAILSVPAPQSSPTAVSLAKTADIAILVATSGATRAADVRRAADNLRQAGVEVAASMLVAKGGAAEWSGAEATH